MPPPAASGASPAPRPSVLRGVAAAAGAPRGRGEVSGGAALVSLFAGGGGGRAAGGVPCRVPSAPGRPGAGRERRAREGRALPARACARAPHAGTPRVLISGEAPVTGGGVYVCAPRVVPA